MDIPIIPQNPVSVAEIAQIWSKKGNPCSIRMVYRLIAPGMGKSGRVPGAVSIAGRWLVPADACDPRQARGRPRKVIKQ
jgi:hypothetical protein